MRRWLLAIGTLLAGSAISSYADYIVIRVNLGMIRDRTEEEKAAENQPGVPGAMGNRGLGGQSGAGFGGGQPGGFGGGQPGGFGGAGGFRGGAAGAAGGGLGGFGQRPQGAPGAALGGQAPGLGAGFGLQGKAGAFTSQQTPATDDEDEKEVNPLIVSAVIEVEHAHLKKTANLGQYHISHKWGDTQVYYAPAPELVVKTYDTPTIAQRFYSERRKIKDDAAVPDKVEQFTKLAIWALEHGLIDQVGAMMDEVGKLDPKDPTLVTFQKVQADMNREITQDDPAIEWRDRFGDDYRVTKSNHYALLNNTKTPSEAQRWLDRLELNYRGFFYWFALRNKALPVPTKRLIAVLAQSAESFNRDRNDIFDELQLVEDGFFAPRERLAVFAAGRLDQGYLALSRLTNEEFLKSKYSVDELFQKKVKPKGLAPNTVARGQTWTLLLKAMEEDSQRAAVTNEGTKQLLSAVGFWPRTVEVPEWLNFGIGSFFETPRGAFWPGVGAPNVGYLDNFIRWDADKKNKFEHNAAEALKSVVKDKYFRDIRAARERDKDKESISGPSTSAKGADPSGKGTDPEEEARKEKELDVARARTLTWAVTYFLMKRHPEGMMRYIEELKNMPRDLDLDEETLYLLFARSFGLMDRADPSKVDENKVANLGNECYSFVRFEPLPWKEAQDEGSKRETKPASGKRGQKASS
jgi:hypothetical protein